ncbi:hypothetical protein GS909_04045, partial [Rhodococcus hoagii]|nr:hypothetical protein [Prescottella equi]
MAGCSVLASAAVASAAVTVPFQIAPAPYGNPNGSFDAPAVRCVASSTSSRGGDRDRRQRRRMGLSALVRVRWLNLSTGASGSARLSDGLGGIPAAVTLRTGSDRSRWAVLSVTPGPITPGVATFHV